MASHLGALAQFVAGYLLIVVTPGPNLLAVASTAALRGLRAALPFCIGLALGASALCAAVAFASDAGEWRTSGTARLLGACLLASVALSVARRRVAVLGSGDQRPTRSPFEDAAIFGAGLLTAASNPLTAAYFLSGFIGLSGTWHWRAAATVSVLAVALVVFPLTAAGLARPTLRSLAMAGERPLRFATAILLTLTAVRTAWPVLFP